MCHISISVSPLGIYLTLDWSAMLSANVIFSSLVSLVILGSIQCQSFSVVDYPNPQYNPEACGRASPSWVCDPSHILGANTGKYIDSEIDIHSKAATT